MTDNSDLSEVDEVVGDEVGNKKGKKENKGLIGSAKKEKKKAKEKETRYAHLESSGEDEVEGKSPAKTKRSKPFMFGSAKKDKDKKKEQKESHMARGSLDVEGNLGGAGDGGTNSSGAAFMAVPLAKEKKKDKKDKHHKLKLKKSKHTEKDSEPDQFKHSGEDLCIFGVPLEVAVERQRCHDGIPLPMVVRLCVDYVEEHGLMLEGIYRSSGVKSKINKLRTAFNSRSCGGIPLSDYEPAVVASVLKQYLRELPDPVLTLLLMPRFEQVSALNNPQKRIEGMKQLIAALPEANRALLNWVFVHMVHVIERERFNKMTLQNVSIVLSPTMQISHRVLNCLFENSHILFDGVQLKKYVPPITGESGGQGDLPESPEAIEEEIRKQDSLLADLHLQISSGAASKKTEEQIWEQQRIVTQLKRKLRMAKKLSESQPETANSLKPKYEPIDYEEELDFSLRVPSRGPTATASTEDVSSKKAPVEVNKPEEPQQQQQQQSSNDNKEDKDTPEEEQEDNEHKVTVMVHRTDEQQQEQKKEEEQQQQKVDAVDAAVQQKISVDATVQQKISVDATVQQKISVDTTVQQKICPPPENANRRSSHVTVIRLGSGNEEATVAAAAAEEQQQPKSPEKAAQDNKAVFKIPPPPADKVSKESVAGIPLLPPPPASNKTRIAHTPILKPVPVSPQKPKPVLQSQQQQQQRLPGAPSTLQVEQATMKSKSLPRGFPSDGSAFASFHNQQQGPMGPQSLNPFPAETHQQQFPSGSVNVASPIDESEEINIEELQMEALRVKLEFDELMAVKSELEQRKRSERKEMEDLREEIATMQTLYQYRTYSVDSSESSSDDASDKDVGEEVEELSKVLSDLVRENRELEEKRLQLCQKIQDERTSCINLRVQIRLEQERIIRRRQGKMIHT